MSELVIALRSLIQIRISHLIRSMSTEASYVFRNLNATKPCPTFMKIMLLCWQIRHITTFNICKTLYGVFYKLIGNGEFICHSSYFHIYYDFKTRFLKITNRCWHPLVPVLKSNIVISHHSIRYQNL